MIQHKDFHKIIREICRRQPEISENVAAGDIYANQITSAPSEAVPLAFPGELWVITAPRARPPY